MTDPNLITAIESLDARLSSISVVIALLCVTICAGFLAVVLSIHSKRRCKGKI